MSIRTIIDRTLFRNGQRRNSPNWAFIEGFRVPHYDQPEVDYLWRLRLIATPWFGIFVHKLCTPDPRDTLHNHPWPFVSIVLRGGYTEYVPGYGDCYATPKRVRFVNIKRFNNSFHWISELARKPTWTLVFVGRRRRTWGYLDQNNKYVNFNEHPFNDQFMNALHARYGSGDMV